MRPYLFLGLVVMSVGCGRGGEEQQPRPSRDAGPTRDKGDEADLDRVTYEGKTLRQWVEQLKRGDGQKQALAIHALSNVGPQARAAVPALIDALGRRDLTLNLLAADALGKVGPGAV